MIGATMEAVTSLPPRRKWSKDHETYGEWLRSAPRSELTKSEQRLVDESLAWELANPATVAFLDRMVGREVALRKDAVTFAEDVLPHVPGRYVPRSYQAGMKLCAFARVGAYLLARTEDGDVLQLRAEWIRPA